MVNEQKKNEKLLKILLTEKPQFGSIGLTSCGTINHSRKRGKKMNHEKLKKHRMAKGLNQTELAKLLNMDRSYYSRIENGGVTPSLALLERIASALGKNLKDFF